MGRNVRFRLGEVDLVVEDPQSRSRWIVEVRGRKGTLRRPVWWLSGAKKKRLKLLAQLMAARTGRSHRVLFLEVRILEIETRTCRVKAAVEEFEIQAGAF